MQKHKENLFLEKFSLLKSQDYTEDIKWSSSSSSDYESTSYNDKFCTNNKNLSRKRKRKKKTLKNISNLDIMIIDASKDHKRDDYRDKSPILVTKRVNSTSPILTSRLPPNKRSSPILSMSVKSLQQKSPILISKTASPKNSSMVRKKLAYNEQKALKDDSENAGKSFHLDSQSRSKNNESKVEITIIKNELESISSNFEAYNSDDNSDLIIKSEESGSSLKAKVKRMNSVKNYFDSYFSSENNSQNINDTPTPEESLKNETIDILSCKTQTATVIQNLSKQDSACTSNSDTSNYFERNKKLKYKKGGLAFRLNVLLKKQNAHVSLWQHERFLAGNSNFVIPKGEHVVFCIKKVDFKFGCYLLDAVDVKMEKFVIFVNSLYVNSNISTDSVLKLYEPYRILNLEDRDYKIVINVCKYEFIHLNDR